ncbi:hypothetical protein [Streptomyces kaempferi]|uniref:Uncharacterized protein n=1 Tax=Streptomyces kaempferi TaxID=333725 RepID=A0ABW3XHD6_9ACTN
MTRPISDLDVPLPLLRKQVVDLVARQQAQAAAESGRPASAGELAEMRHLLYDADPDATIPAFPYPTPQEAS